MIQIPQYNVDSGDFTPEEILDVIPEQERLDRQVQNDEERYLRELEKMQMIEYVIPKKCGRVYLNFLLQ